MKLEENGWLTFDRKISKIDKDALREMHSGLINAVKEQNVILENSAKAQKKWMVTHLPFPESKKGVLDAVTIQKVPYFKDLTFKEEVAPFGNYGDKGTWWDGKDQLVIKRAFSLDEIPDGLSIRIYNYQEGKTPWMHARIYINGVFMADETTRQQMPEHRMAEVIIPKEKMQLLVKGENTLIIQWVPGLRSQTGKLTNFPTKVEVDASITLLKD